MTETSRENLFKAIGPGLLVACAAIGGSHLVWSTRAGAEYGWQLLGLLLLANLFKYPFFLYGQKYTAASGESLLAGYKRKGVAYVYIFMGINVLTGVINIAGVSMLAAALLAGFGIGFLTLPRLTTVLMIGGAVLILLGHYRILDTAAKWVIALLTVSTVAALLLALGEGPVAPADFDGPSPWTWASFGFLIMFMGWMPAPIDLSAWSSLWMFSRGKQTGHFATVKETLVDFHLGYGMAVFLAVVFPGWDRFLGATHLTLFKQYRAVVVLADPLCRVCDDAEHLGDLHRRLSEGPGGLFDADRPALASVIRLGPPNMDCSGGGGGLGDRPDVRDEPVAAPGFCGDRLLRHLAGAGVDQFFGDERGECSPGTSTGPGSAPAQLGGDRLLFGDDDRISLFENERVGSRPVFFEEESPVPDIRDGNE